MGLGGNLHATPEDLLLVRRLELPLPRQKLRGVEEREASVGTLDIERPRGRRPRRRWRRRPGGAPRAGANRRGPEKPSSPGGMRLEEGAELCDGGVRRLTVA